MTLASFWQAIVCVRSPHYGLLESLKIWLSSESKHVTRYVRIVKYFHTGNVLFLYCPNDEWIYWVSINIFVLQELLFAMVLTNLIFILWVKRYVSIKCNTIENTLFRSEQIGAAGAKSPQTSSYDSNHRRQSNWCLSLAQNSKWKCSRKEIYIQQTPTHHDLICNLHPTQIPAKWPT